MNDTIISILLRRRVLSTPSVIFLLYCGIMWISCSHNEQQVDDHARTSIYFENVLETAGIDFQHYGERHRWCEIGPQVQGIATNEEIMIIIG